MTYDSANCRSHCPINFVLETFGDKWTLLVVRDLFKGKRSYGEFLASDEKIATNILADRLKRLEDHGVVSRTIDPANRSKTIYSLTQKGRDFLPIILEMTAWSVKHDALTNVSPSFLDSFRTEKDRMMEIILSNLK